MHNSDFSVMIREEHHEFYKEFLCFRYFAYNVVVMILKDQFTVDFHARQCTTRMEF